MRRLCVDDIEIEVRRGWVRGIRLVVRRNGTVYVSAPLLTPSALIDSFVRERLDWIRQARTKQLEKPPRQLHNITPQQAQELLDYLNTMVPVWCNRMGEEPVQIRLRNMKSQWGNCRWRQRLITFNLQLARVPHELVDYIIVHELSHLKVQNHSRAFHERVQLFIPDEIARRKALKEYT